MSVPDATYIKDTPEFIEVDIGESLTSRTETLSTFRELGPPDLCHIVKTPIRNAAGAKDSASYHYVSGVDASSSASIAIYLNSLIQSLDSPSGWFSGAGAWKVRGGTYCCFNAFSRVDVRVEVKIPGGVEAYIVDLRGERHEPTPAIWLETYLSAHLRSILYADDVNYRLAGYRRLDPIPKPEDEQRFVQACKELFPKGWQLGSDPEIQVATSTSNHLASGILKYFGDSGRMVYAANLFEKLADAERRKHSEKAGSEVDCLTAKAYLGMNEEVLAIRTLNRAITASPQSWQLLHIQVDFLRAKGGRTEWATKLARQAVECAPSEFVTWAKLTECLIDSGDFEGALLTLNSCPMFTYNERDLHRMPTPAVTHLPVKKWIIEAKVLDDDASRDNEADITLLRLPAPSLRGTFAKAYELLTRLCHKVGWDELLKKRSAVFVMEEEYRMQKARDEGGLPPNSTQADDNASITGVAPATTDGGDDDEEMGQGSSATATPQQQPFSSSIPTIKISTDSDHEREQFRTAGILNGADSSAAATGEDEDVASSEPGSEIERPGKVHEEDPEERNKSAATKGDKEDRSGGGSGSKGSGLSFSDKKLCERWLDNLMLVLYEDLRVLTIYKAERSHFRSQQMQYRKTGTEWEILGDLCLRLHSKEDAKEAYQRCLDQKFSAKAYLRLLEMFADEGDTKRALAMAIRLTAYHHRWYTENTYPGAVATNLFKLVRTEGAAKLNNMLLSLNLPGPLLKVMQSYLDYAKTFRVEGSDY